MDNQIYVNNDFELTLDTNVSLANTVTKQIKYQKPDGTTGAIDATVSGTTLVADITDTINDEFGDWVFHSYVVETDGGIYQGDPVGYRINAQWRVP